jgi:GNAT superfamily N-acetyltransferase
MKERVRVENLQESNMDDLIDVCSSKRLGDPIHQQGMALKRQWLRTLLSRHSSCAKIAYYKEKPVAQILCHPEEADITRPFSREGVLVLDCIYNPTPEAQRLGIGTKLIKSVVQDAEQRKTCLGNQPCRFIVAKAFNTGEFLPMPEFYKKNSFVSSPDGELYLPVEGSYEPVPPVGEYEPLSEDRDKAIIFYRPVCQYSLPFARRIEAMIKEVAPHLKIELINEWERPEESIRRRNWWLIVNAKPIHTFFMETEKFKAEIGQAMG